MRKLLIVLVGLLLLFPFLAGLGLKYQYLALIKLYNSQGYFHMDVAEYHLGWLHSEATLLVQEPQSNRFFTVKQHMTHYTATVDSDVMVPAENKWIKPLGNHPILQLQDKIFLNGEISTRYQSSGFDLLFPDQLMKVHVQGLLGHIQSWPQKKSMQGSGKIVGTIFSEAGLEITIPTMDVTFDHTEGASGLWAGTNALSLPTVILREPDNEILTLTNITISGAHHENAGLLYGVRQLSVQNIAVGNEKIGPLFAQVSVQGLRASTIAELVKTYKNIAELREELIMHLPTIMTIGSSIRLDRFELVTPNGQLWMQAQISIPEHAAYVPQTFGDLLHLAHVKASLRIPIPLARQLQQLSVDAWVKAGYLSQDKNDYVTTIDFQGGLWKVNGYP